ncbi:MAG: CBS domain-containing protein [Rhodospirillales bacterium]|nr:CBS domain-containing protein [Rhodospirillales bacterium]
MPDKIHDQLDQMLRGQAHSLSQIMQRNILTCGPSLTVAEAASQMVTTRCSSIVVLEGGLPAGIWTEHDALLVDPDDTTALDRAVGLVMSKPVRTINQNVTIEAATLRFRDEGLRHYVVVDEQDHLVGVVSQSDVVRQHDVRHFLSMRAVGTVLRRSTLILQASSSLAQAAVRLHNHGTDCAVVIYGDGRRGIITERDLLKAVASRKGGLKVGDLANSPIVSVPQTVSVLEARETMERKSIRHLGVTDGEGTPVGMLSYADILASVEFSILRYVEEMLAERSHALNQTQSRLRGALDQLTRSNEELEEFIQAVSQGFEEPLERLTASLDGQRGVDDQELDNAKRDAESLKALLAGICFYASIARTGSPNQTANLAPLAEQAHRELEPAFQAAGAKLRISAALPKVKGDPGQLHFLLTALLGFCLRAPAGSELSLTAERKANHWQISLSVPGPGAAVLAGSDPFLLLPPSQALDERRIGMATAKRIVERHGGKIWLESQMQGGFAIRFTLSEASSSL